MALTLVQNKKDGKPSVSAVPYTGPLNFAALHFWFERFTLSKERVDSEQPADPNAQPPNDAVPEYSDDILVADDANTDQVVAECRKVSCLVAFDDFWRKDGAALERTVATLKKVQRNFSPLGLRVALFNGGCHEYLLPQLNLQFESLPALVLYNHANSEFVGMMGKFDAEDILVFVRKVRNRTLKPVKLSQPLQWKRVNCEEARLKREDRQRTASAPSEDDDELMREVMEEVRKKEAERKFVKDKRKRVSSEL